MSAREPKFACCTNEVPNGAAKIVRFGKHEVGIFRLEDGYHALLNRCPHRGGQLCEGPVCGTSKEVDKAEFIYVRDNELVRCAWHGWEFDIRTGKMFSPPFMNARRFDVVVKNGNEIYVHI